MDKWWVWYTDGLLLVKYVKRPSVLSVVASCYIPFFIILVRPAQSHSFVYSCESSKCKLVPLRHFNPETHMSDWLLIPHYSILESNVKVMRTKKIITYYYQYTRPNRKSASSKHTLSGPQKTDSGLLMHYQPYS